MTIDDILHFSTALLGYFNDHYNPLKFVTIRCKHLIIILQMHVLIYFKII